MNFLRLRADYHAQFEIRVYADIMLDTLRNGYLLLMMHLWIIGWWDRNICQRKISHPKINQR